MGKASEFTIPFKGLSTGFHEFTYEVNHLFFEEIKYSEIKKGQIEIGLTLEKQETMLVLNFRIDGLVEVNCDRCLEPFNYPISGEQQLIVQFGNSFKEETDEIIIIPENDHEINIAPFVYEYVYLLLPLQTIHPENKDGDMTCDNEVIERLNRLNKHNQTDPRWDTLKKLKKNK